MDFETMVLFQERLNLVKDFEDFPLEWEFPLKLKEKYIDFARESLKDTGNKGFKKIDSFSKDKDLDGFFETSNPYLKLDDLLFYCKKGNLKYFQQDVLLMVEGKRIKLKENVFLNEPFSIKRVYSELPENLVETGSFNNSSPRKIIFLSEKNCMKTNYYLTKILRNGIFYLNDQDSLHVTQTGRNHFDLQLKENEKSLVTLILNYEKYPAEIEDLVKNPFDFYDMEKVLFYFGSEKISKESGLYSIFPELKKDGLNFRNSFTLVFPNILI